MRQVSTHRTFLDINSRLIAGVPHTNQSSLFPEVCACSPSRFGAILDYVQTLLTDGVLCVAEAYADPGPNPYYTDPFDANQQSLLTIYTSNLGASVVQSRFLKNGTGFYVAMSSPVNDTRLVSVTRFLSKGQHVDHDLLEVSKLSGHPLVLRLAPS